MQAQNNNTTIYSIYVCVCVCTKSCSREEKQVPFGALAEERIHEDVKEVYFTKHHRERVHHRHGQRGKGQMTTLQWYTKSG